eukprot:TRINITY_DN67076_c8_g5_i2.p1 TRINITY_DN67076_c8_g5~~TRINITY_DN67076_c8_g5_i2.p1  ORF type:complete len:299 (+),score=33.38 TRINITY_DN67076_c8_g5_i2:266-1162(+)
MYFDITGPPTRAALHEYVKYSSDPRDKMSLKKLSSTDYDIIQDQRLNVVDVLMKHPSCNPPFDIFCELTPQQHPRYYSISSRAGAPLELTVGCLQYKIDSQQHFGLCSNFLAGVKKSPPPPGNQGSSTRVWAALQESQFRLPQDHSRPIIMICNGTGIAPFRAFIQDRAHQAQSGSSVGSCLLYFGCRNKQELLHADELLRYQKAGVAELNIAYSREPGVPKTYVYELLSQQKEKLSALINGGKAIVYICGAANTMAKDVMVTLAGVLRPGVKHTDGSAMEVMDGLITNGQAFLDVWG